MSRPSQYAPSRNAPSHDFPLLQPRPSSSQFDEANFLKWQQQRASETMSMVNASMKCWAESFSRYIKTQDHERSQRLDSVEAALQEKLDSILAHLHSCRADMVKSLAEQQQELLGRQQDQQAQLQQLQDIVVGQHRQLMAAQGNQLSSLAVEVRQQSQELQTQWQSGQQVLFQQLHQQKHGLVEEQRQLQDSLRAELERRRDLDQQVLFRLLHQQSRHLLAEWQDQLASLGTNVGREQEPNQETLLQEMRLLTESQQELRGQLLGLQKQRQEQLESQEQLAQELERRVCQKQQKHQEHQEHQMQIRLTLSSLSQSIQEAKTDQDVVTTQLRQQQVLLESFLRDHVASSLFCISHALDEVKRQTESNRDVLNQLAPFAISGDGSKKGTRSLRKRDRVDYKAMMNSR